MKSVGFLFPLKVQAGISVTWVTVVKVKLKLLRGAQAVNGGKMIPTNRCTCSGNGPLGTHLGYKLPVLLVQVGRGRHVILPDTDFALLRRPGRTKSTSL